MLPKDDATLRQEMINEFILELQALTGGHEHEVIRSLNKLQRDFWRLFNHKRLPIQKIYYASLSAKLDIDYAAMTTEDIAKLEGLKERDVYTIREMFFHKKGHFKEIKRGGFGTYKNSNI